MRQVGLLPTGLMTPGGGTVTAAQSRAFREAAGLTQEGLGLAIGMGRLAVHRFEDGRQRRGQQTVGRAIWLVWHIAAGRCDDIPPAP